jgi:hypothetical protein
MAGFQVIMYGRFWVFTEGRDRDFANRRWFHILWFYWHVGMFRRDFRQSNLLEPRHSPTAFDLFTITSTAASVGLVDYSAQATPPFSGQVEGPALAPEPNAGLLAGSGFLALLLIAGRLLRRA